MNFQNDRYTLRFATDADNNGICNIFRSDIFGGDLSVQYLRGEKPLASYLKEGTPRIMVIIDNRENFTAAVGGAVLRNEYVNGKIALVGYLTGLKIHPDYRGKIRFIADCYRFLYEGIKQCDCFYTTILDGNTAAIRLLEKRHRNMPVYTYLGHYTTYCFHGGKKIISVEIGNTKGFSKIMENHFSEYNLTPADFKSEGFGDNKFYCVRENGEITACCFLGTRQYDKQYKMSDYGGIYRLASHLPTKLFGYPEFPRPNSLINYGTVSYLYIKDNNSRLCRDFLRTVAALSGYKLIMWGGFETNPLCKTLDKMKTVKYGSRLYSVGFNGEPAEISRDKIGVEAAIL